MEQYHPEGQISTKWSIKTKFGLCLGSAAALVLKLWILSIVLQPGFLLYLIVGVLCSFILFTLWLSWFFFSTQLLQPIAQIEEASQRIAKGNLQVHLLLRQNGQIGSIAQSVNEIAENLKIARDYTDSIGSGNFEVDHFTQIFSNASEDSLFMSLMNMQEQLKMVSDKDHKQNWVAQGMAEFSKILRSDDTDLQELGTKVITGLVRYLNAQQGGLFVLYKENPKQQYLELTASYAFDEVRFAQRQILIEEDYAEGLVGQAFLENETIYLTNLPEDYTHIHSGLGQSPPKSILLVPLELNGKQEGVIEISSIHTFASHEIEFVEKLSENIASAILTIKVNDHTKKLLRESQELTQKLQSQEQVLRKNFEELQQSKKVIEESNQLIEQQKKEIEKALIEQTEKSEMLEAQEEEMRLNMEELVATQEQMMITQAELDGQLNAINQSTISKVEFSLEGKIITTNKSFCEVVGIDLADIQGREHQSFLEQHITESEEYAQFWKDLQQGIAQSGEYTFVKNNGEIFWVNAVYSPVFNKLGECYKIIMLAFDVSDTKKLLQETQTQAQILQSQEEELRQSMEELQVTQQELKEKSDAIIELKEEEAKNAHLKAREIESKNQLITSSIQYAQNIQRAILPSDENFKNYLQDYFILYLPKDIVSGDFYWFSTIENRLFFAAVDCTGHGVPGAFMSIIGNTLLNEIVNVEKTYDPGRILEKLHKGVKTRLRQEESSNQDGMDIVLCALENISEQKFKVSFAGAKRPLFYFSQQTLLELKGDRKSIGGWQSEKQRIFNTRVIELEKGDCLYLSTDGFVDNPSKLRKKFGVEKFKTILSEHATESMLAQKQILLEALLNHQEDTEQRDDITVLGIKL
ncbi:MAG: SpoIIE family protein phosphatase [Microscillaceae bacterium]|nr:SpoIIE family protein phosphatase [Microscillaceae bacterium]